jgi:hypothetical protein
LKKKEKKYFKYVINIEMKTKSKNKGMRLEQNKEEDELI